MMNERILLTPAAFIKGRIFDEEGLPPQRCHFSLIRDGNRGERHGYIYDSGDHDVDDDGRFSSPPLNPGRYFLRFAGILRKPPVPPSQLDRLTLQQRIFEFIHPNAQDVSGGISFDIKAGEILSDLEFCISRPIWHTVRGKVIGELREDRTHVYVHFIRDLGLLDEHGSTGAKLEPDGTFEGFAQPGRHRLSVWEMAPSNQDGYTRRTNEFASTEIMVRDHDVDGVEIRIP